MHSLFDVSRQGIRHELNMIDSRAALVAWLRDGETDTSRFKAIRERIDSYAEIPMAFEVEIMKDDSEIFRQ